MHIRRSWWCRLTCFLKRHRHLKDTGIKVFVFTCYTEPYGFDFPLWRCCCGAPFYKYDGQLHRLGREYEYGM